MVSIYGEVAPHVYRHDCDEKRLRALRKRLTDNNLQVSSHMPAFSGTRILSAIQTRLSVRIVLIICVNVSMARICSCRNCVDSSRANLQDQNLKDARGRLVDSISQVCTWAEQYYLRLGIEPANKMVTDLVVTSNDALEIIQELRLP